QQWRRRCCSSRFSCDANGRAGDQVPTDPESLNSLKDRIGLTDTRVFGESLTHSSIWTPAHTGVPEDLVDLREGSPTAPVGDQRSDRFPRVISFALVGEIQAEFILEVFDLLRDFAGLDEVLPLTQGNCRHENAGSVQRCEIAAECAVEIVADRWPFLIQKLHFG